MEEKIYITVIRSRRKTMAIEITRDRKVLVRVPMGAPHREVEAFVQSRKDWIRKTLLKLEMQEAAEPAGERLSMEEIRDHLHLDVMTVTGKTLGENLAELRENGYYARCEEGLAAFNARYGLVEKHEGTRVFAGEKVLPDRPIEASDIIRSYDDALGTDGSIAILKGNLAPEGAVIKHTACPKEMFRAVLRAKPFDSEEACLSAVLKHEIEPGDAVFIRYEGPKGSGMPEMFYTSEAISSDKELGRAIALITDGRFSGASTGPVIGHTSPEAAEGGPIALVEEGDLIEINIEKRVLAIIGIHGEKMSPEEIDAILKERKKVWEEKAAAGEIRTASPKMAKGVLRQFAKSAVSPMKGAWLA